MIVIAVLAIIVSIAVPRLSQMIRRANEASTLGKLGAIRTALTIYYADNEGIFPTDLTPLMTPGSKYLTGIIPMYTMSHGSSESVNYSSAGDVADSGGWSYLNNASNTAWGKVWVDCTHTDMKGLVWSSY